MKVDPFSTRKSLAGWRAADVDMRTYLKRGDIVDDFFYDYFLEAMPPVTMTERMLQLGEPSNHVGGRPTFPTLARFGYRWVYCGDCFAGETTLPKPHDKAPCQP